MIVFTVTVAAPKGNGFTGAATAAPLDILVMMNVESKNALRPN
jgi:hypothetical protein